MILVLMGKSGSGKDAILKELEKRGFERVVTCTTRPMREGEVNGKDYYFLSQKDFISLQCNNQMIEYREYQTLVNGEPNVWYYGTSKRPLDMNKDYAIILDKEGAENFAYYYGGNNCFLVYIDTTDEIREQRAISRGSFDKTEWDRRLKDDAKKFEAMDIFADLTVTNNTDLESAVDKVVYGYNNRFADRKHKEFFESNFEMEEQEVSLDL